MTFQMLPSNSPEQTQHFPPSLDIDFSNKASFCSG